MFTSRAEYRILLRQDNADVRLTPRGYKIGLVTKERYDYLQEKLRYVDYLIDFVKNQSVKKDELTDFLLSKKTTPLRQGVKLKDILNRPQINIIDLYENYKPLRKAASKIPEDRVYEILDTVEIEIKYKGYIKREQQLADKFKRLENINIKGKFNYEEIKTISTEGRQKLAKIDPETIGQASRISGVSPSDINVLLILLGR
jgi:tRNA uridine 5-carboxymethylaminomethyl modification enzyme